MEKRRGSRMSRQEGDPQDRGEAGEVVALPLEALVPNPYQPRREFDTAALQELAESIRIHGVLQPVVVRRAGEAYQLVAGERRVRAARIIARARNTNRIYVSSVAQILEVALVQNFLAANNSDPNDVDRIS